MRAFENSLRMVHFGRFLQFANCVSNVSQLRHDNSIHQRHPCQKSRRIHCDTVGMAKSSAPDGVKRAG